MAGDTLLDDDGYTMLDDDGYTRLLNDDDDCPPCCVVETTCGECDACCFGSLSKIRFRREIRTRTWNSSETCEGEPDTDYSYIWEGTLPNLFVISASDAQWHLDATPILRQVNNDTGVTVGTWDGYLDVMHTCTGGGPNTTGSWRAYGVTEGFGPSFGEEWLPGTHLGCCGLKEKVVVEDCGGGGGTSTQTTTTTELEVLTNYCCKCDVSDVPTCKKSTHNYADDCDGNDENPCTQFTGEDEQDCDEALP